MRRLVRARRDRRRDRPCRRGSRGAGNRRAGSVAEPYRTGRRAWGATVRLDWSRSGKHPANAAEPAFAETIMLDRITISFGTDARGGISAALYLLPLAGEFPRAHRAQPEGIEARRYLPPSGA